MVIVDEGVDLARFTIPTTDVEPPGDLAAASRGLTDRAPLRALENPAGPAVTGPLIDRPWAVKKGSPVCLTSCYDLIMIRVVGQMEMS